MLQKGSKKCIIYVGIELEIKSKKHRKEKTMSIKEFFKEYNYYSVQMFVRQVAIALFGLVITISVKGGMQIGVSVFATIFYLFLIFDTAYSTGAKASASVGKKPPILGGLFMSLLANSLNILSATIGLIGWLCRLSENGFMEFLTKAGGIAQSFGGVFLQGMYAGLLTIDIAPEVPLNSCWWSYFLIVIPSILVSTAAFAMGLKGIGGNTIFTPRNAEEEEIRREKKREKRGNNQ